MRNSVSLIGRGARLVSIIIILLFIAVAMPTAEAPLNRAEVPLLFRQTAFTPATLAQAVNHYVAIGEEASIYELTAVDASGDIAPHVSNLILDQRIAWVCQILFRPNDNQPIGNPYTGGFGPPYYPMASDSLPLVPLVTAGSSYFVMSDRMLFAGCPVPISDYLDRCRSSGSFRQSPVPVPTRAQALSDLAMLRKTHAWQEFRWQEFRAYYGDSEAGCWKFMKNQALSIPVR